MKKYLFVFLFLCIASTVYGAWPSDSARTKNWGNETLTDADLEGQFDIIHTYINDMMDASSGHKHDATTDEGPKIAVLAATVTSDPIAFSGQITVAGLTDSGTLDVTGATDLDSTLNVDGNTTLVGTTTCTNNVTMSGGLSVTGVTRILGPSSEKDAATVYQAATDGFVSAYGTLTDGTNDPMLGIYVEAGDATPDVTRAYFRLLNEDLESNGTRGLSVFTVVRKGEYWSVTYSEITIGEVRWHPIG